MIVGYETALHYFVFFVGVALILYPTGRILRRLGFSPLWSILMFLPLINVIALWFLAFAEWPAQQGLRR
jgi:hypothetical protein